MSRSFGPSQLLVCLIVASGCARPNVDEAEFAADAGVSDARALPDHTGDEPEASAPLSDASVAAPEAAMNERDASTASEDAGCEDSDHDTVCDARDNCPDVPNTNQADADSDGIGDACSTPAVDAGVANPCGAEMVATSATAGDAVLSGVLVNGMASPVTVRKGDHLTVTLNYAFGACAIPLPGQPRFMTIGIDGQNTGNCRILLEVPCPTEVSATTTLNVDAPTKTGPAYIVALGRQGFACSDSLNNSKRIAALCVE